MRVISIPVFALLISSVCLAEEINLNGLKVGTCKVEVTDLIQVPGAYLPKENRLQISQGDKIVFEKEGGKFSLGDKLLDPRQRALLKPGNDINKNGMPDLVLLERLSRNRCCLSIHLFECVQSFRHWGTIEAGFDTEPEFYSSETGELNYRTHDFTFGGWGSTDLSRPAPEIILSIGKEKISLNTNKMKRPPATEDELKSLAKELKAELEKTQPAHSGRDLPVSVTGAVLGLIYSGNASQVPELLQLSWPTKHSSWQSYWTEVQMQLRKSPYWPELAPFLATN